MARLMMLGGGVALCGLLGLPACRCSSPKRLPAGQGPAVVMVDSEHRKRALVEKEPNDKLELATVLPVGEAVEGTLVAGDVDWYRVEVEKEGILSAKLRGVADLDLVLEAYGKDGKRLVRVDNAKRGGGEVLANLAVSSGKYYLVVRTRDTGPSAEGRGDGKTSGSRRKRAAETYRLISAVREAVAGEEMEPNWSRSRASVLALGGEVTGYLGWKTDSDWYRVDLSSLEKGALLRIELDVPEQVWAYLALRDARGRVIQRRLGGPGETLVLANLQPPADSPVVYVVARTGKTANVDTRYSLRIEQQLKENSEVEPNGTVATATVLPAEKTLSGVMTDRRDRDIYVVTVSAPSLLHVSVTPSWRLDAALAVVDSKGKPIVQIDAAGLGQRELLPAVYVVPPRAYVSVFSKKAGAADATGSYQIVAKLSGSAAFEHEPNDERKTATPWNVGVAELSGYLFPAGDEDWFSFVGQGGGVVLGAAAQAPVKLRLRLVDEQQTTIASGSAKSAGEEVTLQADVGVGKKVWLVVSGDGSSATQAYRLKRMSKVVPLSPVP